MVEEAARARTGSVATFTQSLTPVVQNLPLRRDRFGRVVKYADGKPSSRR